ncbi:hypothetical protein Ancab_037992 [Ancistrocladus abbreviatus]
MERENNFFQLFIKLIDHKTLTLQFPISNHQSLTTQSIKKQLQSLTQIPIEFQKLTLNGKFLHDSTPIPPSLSLSTLHLTFSLLGGKGGFGSLLRGAATKAGQKKTNNFDACRDMSGRRLRHVNAEKKLEEWKAEEEERRLEKKAEEYLKNVTKKVRKEGGSDGAEKYVEKYRKESARCVEAVERSVRESVEELMVGKKRKLIEKLKEKAKGDRADAKKLKIWMGKRKLAESDSDVSDDDGSRDEDMENEKSVITDIGNQSDSSKEVQDSPGSIAVGQLNEGEGGSSGSCSDEEKEAFTAGSMDANGSPSGSNSDVERINAAGPSSMTEEENPRQSEKSCSSALDVIPDTGKMETEKQECEDRSFANNRLVGQPSSISSLGERKEPDSAGVVPEGNGVSESKSVIQDGKVDGSIGSEIEQPLNLEDFSSAAELEVLGMERLKSELQARGLKCGGTLQERASRLFLLKATPLEQFPKKLFAKK